MIYYVLRISTNPKEVGDYPHLTSYSYPYKITDLYRTAEEGKLGEDFQLPDYFELNHKTYLCDLLSSNYFQFRSVVISEKMYALLAKFDMDEHELYDCYIRVNHKTLKYYLLRFPFSRNDIIEWSDTEWYIIKSDSTSLDTDSIEDVITVGTYEELLNISLSKKLKIKKLVFNFQSFRGDIFYTENILLKKIVLSENLQKAMISEEISGLQFYHFAKGAKVEHFAIMDDIKFR